MTEHSRQTPSDVQHTPPPSLLTTPSLVLAYILSSFPIMLISLFITDMAQLFDVEVGMIAIARSAAEIGSVAMGILLGGLSVRYPQRSLLLLGIAITCVATVTLGVLAVFPLFLATFAALGVSRVTIRSMSQSLVGELFPTGKRPTITGYLVIGETGGYLIGSAISLFVPNFQAISLFFLCPLALVVAILVLTRLPSTPLVQRNPLTAFREVFRNRSATMMLLGHGLFVVMIANCILTFFMPLYLQKFHADRTFVTMVYMLVCMMLAGVGLISGRVITRFGRKPVVVVTSIAGVLLCALMMLAPRFDVSLLGWIVSCVNVGLYLAASNSYALEQLPAYRGTMMSLNLTVQFIAQGVGSSVGGLILMGYGFDGLGVACLLGLAAGPVFHFLTIDPTQTTARGTAPEYPASAEG